MFMLLRACSTRRLLLPFLLLVAQVGLTVNVSAQDRGKLRKDLESKVEELGRIDQKIGTAKSDLEGAKTKTEKDYGRALDKEKQLEVGEKLAPIVQKAIADKVTLDALCDLLEPDIRGPFGSTIYKSAQQQLRDFFGSLLEETGEISPVRCARMLDEAFGASFDRSSYDKAWSEVLSKQTREFAALNDLETDRKKKDRDVAELRSQLTADVRGNIPKGMVAVPQANAALGVTTKDIEKITVQLNDKADQNKWLFLASQTETKTIPTFVMDRYEITHLAYWYFCQQTGRAGPRMSITDSRTGKDMPLEFWPGGKIPAGWEQRPITYVSYDDVLEYCYWTGCRLPTEDEWEVAARSGQVGYDGRNWPWGNAWEPGRANDSSAVDNEIRRNMSEVLKGLVKGFDAPAVVPVGVLDSGASPLGIYDLAGNAAEWTSSPFLPRKSYKSVEGVDVQGQFNEDLKVVRGGHSDLRGAMASSVNRGGANPNSGYKYIGFRRARSANPAIDILDRMSENRKLDARVQDFALTDSDTKAKRTLPTMDRRATRMAILEDLAWNSELDVPGAYRKILVVNRLMSDFSKFDDFERAAKAAGEKDAVLIGMIATDVAFVEPSLKPGVYFVAFDGGGKEKDPKTNKPVIIKPAFLYVPYKIDEPTLRIDATGKEIYSINSKDPIATELKPTVDKDKGDTLKVIFSLDKPGRGEIQVELNLKAAPGTLEAFN